jgi:hypothetical protein
MLSLQSASTVTFSFCYLNSKVYFAFGNQLDTVYYINPHLANGCMMWVYERVTYTLHVRHLMHLSLNEVQY